MEADPPFDSVEALLDELDDIDAEHPDVALSHESGWGLSAFPSGRLLYENVEDLTVEPRQMVLDRDLVKDLFRALAIGDLERLEAENWQPYRVNG